MTWRRCGSVLTVAAGLALTGCQDPGASVTGPSQLSPSTSAAALGDRAVLLHFNEDSAIGDRVDSLTNAGTLPVRVEIVTLGQGEVRTAPSEVGQGYALDFPSYSAKDPGFAIISVVGTGRDDVLSPGDDPFTFGADLAIDDNQTSGSEGDNGDNLIQRGLFEGSGQYKIQVDHRRITCRVQGLSGAVIVKAKETVKPGEWYRSRCTRRGDDVTLAVAPLDENGEGEWTEVTETGPIGAVVMPDHTPLTVGGKLAADGTLFPSSTDQFNGKIDRVVYRPLG